LLTLTRLFTFIVVHCRCFYLEDRNLDPYDSLIHYSVFKEQDAIARLFSFRFFFVYRPSVKLWYTLDIPDRQTFFEIFF